MTAPEKPDPTMTTSQSCKRSSIGDQSSARLREALGDWPAEGQRSDRHVRVHSGTARGRLYNITGVFACFLASNDPWLKRV
jgi:hypothetical protein